MFPVGFVNTIAGITEKEAATYNVSTSDQTIAANQYLAGAQTIRGVTTANLSAGNIKAGVTVKVGDAADDDRIAGVAGTFTSDGTAEAGDIMTGKIAYVNGNKVTGTFSWSRQSDYVYNVVISPAVLIDVTSPIYKAFDLGDFGRFIFPYKANILGESEELPVVCSNHDSSHYYAIYYDDPSAAYQLAVSTIVVHCVRITGL